MPDNSSTSEDDHTSLTDSTLLHLGMTQSHYFMQLFFHDSLQIGTKQHEVKSYFQMLAISSSAPESLLESLLAPGRGTQPFEAGLWGYSPIIVEISRVTQDLLT